MMNKDPFQTQRDVGWAVTTELSAVGFGDAEEIGRGGFGIVYRCTQVTLDRTVAVKVLTELVDENRERFTREQRAMGRLTGHPNIVGVLQVGETASGYPYLVMQHHTQGSIEARIRRLGGLALQETLGVGVKMAGALESAHRLGILHRDVKPANILLTNYGEPALSDFGIAHVAGGFTTASGTFTGSPAFTAPEILSGDSPSVASDVYALGATLFCALTGHAAFERRSGEQVVAQFLRIATEAAPDLRERSVPDDVAAVVEKAMCRDPRARPSAVELGEELQRVQTRHNFTVEAMALWGQPSHRPTTGDRVRRVPGNLPLELTSFIGRRAELGDVNALLSTSRLVTLTGLGGVGKTRLALRVAWARQLNFPDGVWLVELGDLRDGRLLVDVVAAALGLRNHSARTLATTLVEFLAARTSLLLLDNCEQVIDAVAELSQTLLRACPDLRILATSRERLGIGSESALALAPLALPGNSTESTPSMLRGYDAVALFTERAASALPSFALTEENQTTVARICARVDGLPLAIELAAARLRAMTPEQILDRLENRYTLLTHGSRGAPTRQQSLVRSIGWSYDLCTPAEQQLWGRLSVFAGTFDLEAAEAVCGDDLAAKPVLDLITSLVDKSIVIRTEANGIVRFRLLDTLRDYGADRLQRTGLYPELRRRHQDWYRRLALRVAEEWFGPRQLEWITRLAAETPNLRNAMEFSLSGSGEVALTIASVLHPFWLCRGMLGEARHWLDRALASTAHEPSAPRCAALYGDALITGLLRDLPAGRALVAEALAFAERLDDPLVHGMAAVADGFTALVAGEFEHACAVLEEASGRLEDPMVKTAAMLLLGLGLEFRSDTSRALIWHEKALALSRSRGELVYRVYALWSLAIGWWRNGRQDRGKDLLKECLRIAQQVNDIRTAAGCLDALAWIATERSDPRLGAVMMGAAAALAESVAAPILPFPHHYVFHDEYEEHIRNALDSQLYETARQQGRAMDFGQAVAYALQE
jgi:predicted ATPase